MGITDTTSRVTYSGNGATTAFAFNFRVFETDELYVIVRTDSTGAEAVQTLTTHYTVALNSGEGGTVTMVTAPASGETLYIGKSVAETQPESITVGSLPAATLEQMYDRLTMLIHQVKEKTRRVPLLGRSTPSVDKTMAEPVDGSLLGWDASGNLVNYTVASLGSSTTVIDEDDMTSDSDSAVPTQQSVKAYVDNNAVGPTLTTKGDLVTRTSSALARLAVGSFQNQSLVVDSSTSTGMKWSHGPGVEALSSTVALSNVGNQIISVNTSGGDVTVTLPAVSGTGGLSYLFKVTDATNTLIIDGNSSETIDGLTTLRLQGLYDHVKIISTGSEWLVIDRCQTFKYLVSSPSSVTLGGNMNSFSNLAIEGTRHGNSLHMGFSFNWGTSAGWNFATAVVPVSNFPNVFTTAVLAVFGSLGTNQNSNGTGEGYVSLSGSDLSFNIAGDSTYTAATSGRVASGVMFARIT